MESSSSSPAAAIALPSGVTIGAGRETSQTNAQGAVIQGMVFPITTAAGSTSSVFVPYSEIHNTVKVQALIAARVAAIVAISG
jgi:predicted aconitase with swiveling domain